MEGTLEPPKKKKRKPCPRCGNFAKTAKLGARRLCVECLDRCDPIEREPILVTTLLSGGVALMARSSGGWIPIVVPMVVAQVALGVALPDGSAINFIVGSVVGVVAALLAASMRGDLSDAVVSGTPLPGVGDLLSRALSRGWTLFVGYLLMSFTVGLYSLLLVVPGILRALDLQLTLPIQVLEGASPSESLRLSTERMQGFRATSFFTSLVAVVPVTALLLALALGAGNPLVTIAVLTLVHLSGHLVPFITMALYLKLRWRAAHEKLAPTTA